MSKKYLLPLGIKILLPIFIGSLFIVSFSWLYLKDHFEEELETQIKQRAEVIANSIDQFAWINGISPNLKRLIASVAGEKDLEAVAIIRSEETPTLLLSSGDLAERDKSLSQLLQNFNEAGSLLDAIRNGKTTHGIYKDVEEDQYDYIYIIPTQLKEPGSDKLMHGAIYVELLVSELLDDLKDDLIKVTLVLAIGVTALSILTYLVLQHYVFLPIGSIKKAVNLRASGNNSAHADRLNHDEIGEVGTALNVMLDSLESNKQKLVEEIAERKRQQDNLKIANEQAQQARIEAERANSIKSEFLSNMSHELRTPMHAILNYANMGMKRVGKEEPEKIMKCLTNIQTAGNRLLWLLNNLLDLAKLESGKMEFKLVPDDFLEVIAQTKMELDSLLKEKKLNMVIDSSTDTKAVFDRIRLMQVMVNLFSNAIKFSPEKGNIRVILADAKLANGAQALSCSIQDEGTGIPESELESVFDKFIQSSKTKTGAGGTGLGLSISREIINAHGGRIWAQNGSAKGAVFNILLPKTMPRSERSFPAKPMQSVTQQA